MNFSPMLAIPGDGKFAPNQWTFEPKLDGIRAIAHLDTLGQGIHIYSRKGEEVAFRYPDIAQALHALPHQHRMIVLDGEIVAENESGTPDFNLLQRRMNLSRPFDIQMAVRATPLRYHIFDLLYVEGLTDLPNKDPIEDRRALLNEILPVNQPSTINHQLRRVPVYTNGMAAYQAAIDQGLEGVMAKKIGSIYEPGKRSPNWVKWKPVEDDDYIVCGYTPGEGARAGFFGALILGRYEAGTNNLIYVGKVGTGFTDKQVTEIARMLYATPESPCPFSPPDGPPYARWVPPDLVVTVRHQPVPWGQLRFPVFLRLRPDKSPADCTV